MDKKFWSPWVGEGNFFFNIQKFHFRNFTRKSVHSREPLQKTAEKIVFNIFQQNLDLSLLNENFERSVCEMRKKSHLKRNKQGEKKQPAGA